MRDSLKEELNQRLGDLAREHRVPGASLAVLHNGTVWSCAAGYLNLNTKVETTPDSLFQIGSITKVYTATLVMQLVDEGRIDLDAPIQSYLPDVRFADAGASARITVRHLLSHTSGVDGDYFGDFGYGDDAIERYVVACSDLPQLFEPGAMFSYCNAGFSVLGRLLEVSYGMTYHKVLKNKLVVPLGTSSPKTLLNEIVMNRVAVGHETNRGGGEPTPVTMWCLPHAAAPQGSTPCATASDVIEFARLHLDGGRGVLSKPSVRAMQQPEVEIPSTRPDTESWGLGWSLDTWDGSRVFGHDGGTIGQTSYLRVSPENKTAAALLTNSYTSLTLYDRLFGLVFGELANISKPDRPTPPDEPEAVDPSRYVGTYERLGVRSEVFERDGGLHLDESFSGEMADIEPAHDPRPLIPAGGDLFFVFNEDIADHYDLHFLGRQDGRARYLYDGRIAPRVK